MSDFSVRNNFSAAITDLVQGLARWRLWTMLAWQELARRYRRSLLGVLWLTIGFGAFVGTKVLIFAAIMSEDQAREFALHIIIGFWLWTFMLGTITTATDVFTSSKPWLMGVRLPRSVFIFRSIGGQVISFSLSGIIAVVFIGLFRQSFSIHDLWLAPVLLVYLLNALWIQMMLGALCTRFQDLLHLVHTVMRLLFFLTPIIWMADADPLRSFIALYNPFAHFLEIAREPMIHGTIPVLSWIIVGAITCAGLVAGFITFALSRRRIVFWL